MAKGVVWGDSRSWGVVRRVSAGRRGVDLSEREEGGEIERLWVIRDCLRRS